MTREAAKANIAILERMLADLIAGAHCVEDLAARMALSSQAVALQAAITALRATESVLRVVR